MKTTLIIPIIPTQRKQSEYHKTKPTNKPTTKPTFEEYLQLALANRKEQAK